jgi:hypothetical protein
VEKVSKPIYGPSLYYASDKNIFDALNQHKVDHATVCRLFKDRNTLVSREDSREELAAYFSRLTHDYFDHQEIANRLGVAVRRERITSMNLVGAIEDTRLTKAINSIKERLQEHGDTVRVSKSPSITSIDVQYTVIDYRRTEFTQVQRRDGTLELIPTADGLKIRNTKNDYLDAARDELIAKLSSGLDKPIPRREVSLFDIPNFRLRSKFFVDLASHIQGYSLSDVSAVFVYKSHPEELTDHNDSDTYVERVNMKGRGVTRSGLLSTLNDDEYYIFRMTWRTKEILGEGHEFEIDATFADPKDCTGFSFLLTGVYARDSETGKTSEKRRMPTKSETDQVSKVVEKSASDALDAAREAFDKKKGGGQ